MELGDGVVDPEKLIMGGGKLWLVSIPFVFIQTQLMMNW
jgi:hypothetical protein